MPVTGGIESEELTLWTSICAHYTRDSRGKGKLTRIDQNVIPVSGYVHVFLVIEISNMVCSNFITDLSI